MLEEYFAKSWDALREHYESGQITSERHLQAILFSLLNADPDFSETYSISIEPKIAGEGDDLTKSGLIGTIPDMIISVGLEIVAVVELKFTPRAVPK